jgi:hypothetical protein
LRRVLVEINAWLRQERNTRKLPDLWQAVAGKIRGHLTYFGVTDNSHALKQCRMAVRRLLLKWLKVAQPPEPETQFHLGRVSAL